jgi:hypothetical protein
LGAAVRELVAAAQQIEGGAQGATAPTAASAAVGAPLAHGDVGSANVALWQDGGRVKWAVPSYATVSVTCESAVQTIQHLAQHLAQISAAPLCHCANGGHATGAACAQHGDHACASCGAGFSLQGGRCEVITTTPAPPPALTYTKLSNKNCAGGGAVGYFTADCQVGTRPTCSGDKYKCYNAQGAGYYNWEWGRCWMKTQAQAEAVCEKYRYGLTTANVRQGGQITFNACTAVGQDGGGYEPRICKSLNTWTGMHTFMVSNNGNYGFPGYQN